MIPSLLNLMIGGASLARGLPGLPSVLLRYMPEGRVMAWDRRWIALVLTGQIVVGAALGCAAQVAIVVVMIFYLRPWLGFTLLDMAQGVADLNLPLMLTRLF